MEVRISRYVGSAIVSRTYYRIRRFQSVLLPLGSIQRGHSPLKTLESWVYIDIKQVVVFPSPDFVLCQGIVRCF
jgi:hypothetical protein